MLKEDEPKPLAEHHPTPGTLTGMVGPDKLVSNDWLRKTESPSPIEKHLRSTTLLSDMRQQNICKRLFMLSFQCLSKCQYFIYDCQYFVAT